MIVAIRYMMLVPMFWLFSCNEEKTSKEEARIQREVEQRVESIRTEMKVSENRWHTARIVCFCLLAGGSLIWLFNGGGAASGNLSYPLIPDGKNHENQNRRRVIDRPHFDPDDEPDDHPYRR
jgi:hypothetical protein